MVSAQSDFIRAELHNINNSVTTDSEFSFHDFENDIGNTLPYRKQLVSGHIIEYDSDSGFSITHPDIIGEIKVDDVLQAYKEAFKSNFSAYTTYISANYLVQFSPWQSNIFKKLNHTAQVENTNVTEITGGTDALARRGQYRCHNNDEQANCGQGFASGNKIKSAHNCKNAGGKGYSCTFLQAGGSYGTCCYKINAAQSCNYEGGGCLTGNPGNTCGSGCMS
ncbi:BDM_1a_G0016770.mRNA.1.CDS.1 [Saccharomyces cerevisiae]|nr:BDM_1a_G0016770.mRNA.1.CDS.1 [Saccharomyces cerevisiae]CAI7108418.1 BDM_1a_G0016770.mRNA.1.CDS.1 [Saccharomyces cerevisiae]